MSRSILCPECNTRMKELAKQCNELYESVEGISKGEFLCDSCMHPNYIHIGDACFASMLLPNEKHFNYNIQKPEIWMNDYIIPNVNSQIKN